MASQPTTSAERASIRLYCGWSARFRQTDSRLEQSMNALDEGDDDTMAEVRLLLGKLAQVDVDIEAARPLLQAAKVGSIELQAVVQIGMLRSEGRRYVGRLAATLGVEVRQDVYSGRGPSGRAGTYGMMPGSGGGNLPPLG